MWIFGQVWFACLVGFAAGVLLDWVVRVRPLASRVVDLETRLEADGRSARADAVAGGGSMFERGRYEAPGRFDSTGFGGDSSRGLLTPASQADHGSLAADLLEHETSSGSGSNSGAVEPASGVEDYPGVARLSGIWADEAAEESATSWQPSPPPVPTAHIPTAADHDVDDHEEWNRSADEPTWEGSESVTPTSVTPLIPSADADEQYLEFLRAGGAADPDTSSPDVTATEVTSVLPYAAPGEESVEGYQAYEAYEEFSGNGYGTNGHDYQSEDYGREDQHGGYEIVDYQQEDLSEPIESSSPLPHRSTSDLGRRYAPFEIPFGQLDNSDVQPHSNEITPIGQGGFQPFQKQDDEADAVDSTDPASWFDLTDPGPGSIGAASMTSRMLPVGLPGEDHPDLLGTSVFGGDEDPVYQEEGAARSLFEPVIAPDIHQDDYAGAAFEAPPAFDPTAGQGTTPRPIRVRTGMDPMPSNGAAHSLATDTDYAPTVETPFTPASEMFASPTSETQFGSTGERPAGPFGPGSALPLPDGTAPSSEFRVKARTSSMVFHTESSPFYERLEPQVWFRDPQDAQRAGFTSWERPRTW
jgi:hypothetical protein